MIDVNHEARDTREQALALAFSTLQRAANSPADPSRLLADVAIAEGLIKLAQEVRLGAHSAEGKTKPKASKPLPRTVPPVIARLK
jgi:hypothetical protein